LKILFFIDDLIKGRKDVTPAKAGVQDCLK